MAERRMYVIVGGRLAGRTGGRVTAAMHVDDRDAIGELRALVGERTPRPG